MSDFIIKIAGYTLSVWETSKAHERFFFKWRLSQPHKELPEYPVSIKSSGNSYTTLDKALAQVVDAFYDEAGWHGFYCQTCKCSERHITNSADLTEDASQVIVHLFCLRCGTKRTAEYICKVVG